jgi:hypothetical protein
MLEGVGPDILIKRGATPKYVSMVCREFVEDSRKKRGGPAKEETREAIDTVLTPELVTLSLPAAPRSPSIGSVELARDLSASSIGSVDASLKVERISSPEQPARLIPTSSWAPAQKLPASPIHIESYRPGRPAGSSGPASLAIQSARSAPLGPLLGPGGIPRPLTSHGGAVPKNSLRARASDLSPVVKRPDFSSSNGQNSSASTTSANGTYVEPHGPQPHIAPTPVAHGAHNVLASLNEREAAPLARAIPIPITAPSSVTVLPIASTSAATATKASTMNALLESKRRAMESMKRGRKASENVNRPETRPPTPPLGMRGSPLPSRPGSVPPVHPLPSRPPSVPPSLQSTQENLEDQVAALEQEMIGLREAEPIVVEDEEEGEIPDEVVIPTQPRMAPIIPATTPIRLNKSTKRPNAEDMMNTNRSQSISSRAVHPSKRRQFGAAMRMKRLIISLDDSDDEDNEDQAPTPTAAELEADRQRLLKEKEDDMMKLREKILRLQAKAEKEKKAKAKEAALQAAAEAAVPLGHTVGVEDVVMAESADADRPETPALPTVPLVHDSSTEVQDTPGKWISHPLISCSR